MAQSPIDEQQLRQLLTSEVLAPQVAPGATLAVGRFNEGGWKVREAAVGYLSPGDATAVTTSTLFDLASLTKPVVALCAASLHARGVWSLDDALAKHLPWSRSTPTGALSLELHLAHRAGLEAHRDLTAKCRVARRLAQLECARARRFNCAGSPPLHGFPPLYSDLGYILIGAALEARMALPLDECLRRELTHLGLQGFGSTRQLGAANIAATEELSHRGGMLRGVVHDDNAWALSGTGCSGHAGLFAPVAAVTSMACALVDHVQQRGRLLPAPLMDRLLMPRPGGSLRAGFDSVSPKGSSAGPRYGPKSFGHLGFTGTSFWCDPDQDLVCVLLTNRVCPSRSNLGIRAARPRVHSQAAALSQLWETLRAS